MVTEQEARDMQTAIEDFQALDAQAIATANTQAFGIAQAWFNSNIRQQLDWQQNQALQLQFTNSLSDRELLHTFANRKNGFLNLGLGHEVSKEKIQKLITSLINDYDYRKELSRLMLKNYIRSGINNVISLIFSQYENFKIELNK